MLETGPDTNLTLQHPLPTLKYVLVSSAGDGLTCVARFLSLAASFLVLRKKWRSMSAMACFIRPSQMHKALVANTSNSLQQQRQVSSSSQTVLGCPTLCLCSVSV